MAVPKVGPRTAFENAAAPFDGPPGGWIRVVGKDKDLGNADISGQLESGFEALDGIALSAMRRRNVVPDVADLLEHVRSVNVVTNADDTDNISLVVDDPAVRTWDESSRKVYASLIVVKRLDVVVEVVSTVFVPQPRLRVVGGIVVQHAQERVAVGLVEVNYGHGRVHYSREFENAIQ